MKQTIPGNYSGSNNFIVESVHFNTNGTYEHNVYQGVEKISSDSGKWDVAKDSARIDLAPNEFFFQFYDPMSRSIKPKPEPFASYVYWPIMNGTFTVGISPSVNYEYSLLKQSGSSSESVR